ncbi:MAG: YkvA family protein [Limnobacter sp.]|uniref:YkvA family protein n=1 Tax=Limnobacter sp. TaxID=2003368 RepID=UPI00391D0850
MLSRFVPLWARLKALRTHGRLLWHAFRHQATPLWIKALMVASLVYLVSPLDLVPDILLWLGLTDDLIVITVVLWLVNRYLPREVHDSLPGNTPNPQQGH